VRCDAKGNSAVIRKSEYAALNKAHEDFVKRVFGGTPPRTPQRDAVPPNAPPPQINARGARTNPADAKRQTSPEAPSAARKPAPATFLVLKTAELPNSKGGRDTSLLIKSSEGRELQTFLRGYDPALVTGAVLKNAKISQKLSEGVVFFILNSYETGAPAAA
jgi:hypothetical protein